MMPPSWLAPGMALKGPGRIIKSDSKHFLLYISKEIHSDSAFFLKRGDRVQIEIDREKKRLMITKAD